MKSIDWYWPGLVLQTSTSSQTSIFASADSSSTFPIGFAFFIIVGGIGSLVLPFFALQRVIERRRLSKRQTTPPAAPAGKE